MGFTFGNSAVLKLEIEGKEYQAVIDRPEFIDFWRVNNTRLDSINDPSNATTARDIVVFCVDMVTALLGVDVSREIFDGREVSLVECAALIGYILEEINAQNLMGYLDAVAAKYGAGSILR